MRKLGVYRPGPEWDDRSLCRKAGKSSHDSQACSYPENRIRVTEQRGIPASGQESYREYQKAFGYPRRRSPS
jgi:hypothetical protein